MWAIISSAVAKGPCVRPFMAFASWASMLLRCAGVYSSLAFGNWERSITSLGVKVILPRSTVLPLFCWDLID